MSLLKTCIKTPFNRTNWWMELKVHPPIHFQSPRQLHCPASYVAVAIYIDKKLHFTLMPGLMQWSAKIQSSWCLQPLYNNSMLPGKTCILAQMEQPKANTTCITLPSRDSSCSSPFKWESSPEPSTLQWNGTLYTGNSMMWLVIMCHVTKCNTFH